MYKEEIPKQKVKVTLTAYEGNIEYDENGNIKNKVLQVVEAEDTLDIKGE